MKNVYQTMVCAVLLLSSITTLAQVPKYNSYPSASAVLFLDFDGHRVEGTSWNASGPIICASAGYNATQISEIFNRVAEDYRPFNINITTDSTKYWSAPANRRMRVVLTPTWEWHGQAGGVAFMGSFTWGDNTPAFVFTSLLNNNIKNIAEAASHEAGHTFGLRHQSSYNDACGKVSEYNSGTGVGEIGWAPIMGVGYYRNFTVWHNGNTTSCSNYQNDLAIITNANNGIGYRVDDHSNTFNTASNTTFSNNQFILSGVVAKTDDVDIFKFTYTQKGKFELDAIPYNVGSGNIGSNLDLQVDLLDASLNVLGEYNPGNELSSIVDTVLNAGTYYLRIDGKGNAYASEYGSLGSYSLQGRFSEVNPLPLHKLELKGTTETNSHKLNWIIEADETVVKQVVEVSVDGRTFNALAEAEASARTYVNTAPTSGTLLYRLSVTFDNGRHYYSNTIALRKNGHNSKPQLITNLINGNSLMVSSPDKYDYMITDFNGRVISKGQVTKGSSTINTSYLSAGMYMIRFTGNNEHFAEKFLKE